MSSQSLPDWFPFLPLDINWGARIKWQCNRHAVRASVPADWSQPCTDLKITKQNVIHRLPRDFFFIFFLSEFPIFVNSTVYIRDVALFPGDMLEQNNVRINMWSWFLETLPSVDEFIYWLVFFKEHKKRCNLVPSYVGEARHLYRQDLQNHTKII